MQKQPRQMQARQFVPAVFVTTLAATTAWAVVAPAGALALGIVGGAYLAAAVVACPRRDGRQPPLGPGATGRVRSAACQLRRRLRRRVTTVVPRTRPPSRQPPCIAGRHAQPLNNSELLFAGGGHAAHRHLTRAARSVSGHPASERRVGDAFGLILPPRLHRRSSAGRASWQPSVPTRVESRQATRCSTRADAGYDVRLGGIEVKVLKREDLIARVHD